MYYFCSDTHFLDETILERDKYPFDTQKELDEEIIKNINNICTKDDILYHLGDFISYHKTIRPNDWQVGLAYVKRLKPKVMLIVGNSEERLINSVFNEDINKFREYCINLGFIGVEWEIDIKVDGVNLHLKHVPPLKAKENTIELYGHIHRVFGITAGCGCNVALASHYFKPITLEQIIYYLDQRKICIEDWLARNCEIVIIKAYKDLLKRVVIISDLDENWVKAKVYKYAEWQSDISLLKELDRLNEWLNGADLDKIKYDNKDKIMNTYIEILISKKTKEAMERMGYIFCEL